MNLNFSKTIFIFFLLLLINSCNDKCIVDNIEVSELLGTVAKEKHIDYCKLLQEALIGNKNSIKKISLLEFGDAVGYDHGYVLVTLIKKIGEKKYIKAISDINRKEKYLIESYLDVGLEYGYENKNLKEYFPKVYVFLKS